VARAAVPGRLGAGRRLEWRVSRLAEYRDENPTARSLILDVPDWPGHLAGQHVDVRLTAPDGYSTERSYSLAAPTDDSRVQLTVQRVPNGEVSPYLIDVFSLGNPLEIRGPVGGWFVWRPAEPGPVLLVGGGSGIVPLMAMIRTRRAANTQARFRLVYSVRSPAEVYYASELAHPPSGDHGVEVSYIFTRATPEGWPVPPRRIQVDDLPAEGFSADVQPACFVCGPTPFVEAVATMLVGLGYDPDRVKTERFGPTGG
jgi:ferredoxin-NADP reductase